MLSEPWAVKWIQDLMDHKKASLKMIARFAIFDCINLLLLINFRNKTFDISWKQSSRYDANRWKKRSWQNLYWIFYFKMKAQ